MFYYWGTFLVHIYMSLCTKIVPKYYDYLCILISILLVIITKQKLIYKVNVNLFLLLKIYLNYYVKWLQTFE